MRRKSSLSILKPYLKPYRLQLTLGPLAKLIEAVLELLMPLFMARVIDGALLHRGETAFFVSRGGQLLLLVVLGMLFSFTCQYMASVASQGVGTLLRRDLFAKIQMFSFAQLDRFGTSTLANRLTLDISNIQFAVAMLIRLAIRAPFLVLGGSLLAFYISPPIAVLMLLSIPLAAVLLTYVMRRTLPLIQEAQRGTDKLGRLVSDHLSGVRIIRAFNRSEHERSYFAASNRKVTDSLELAGKISAFMNPGTVLVVNLAIVAALYLGGGLVQNNELSPGEMIALMNYFTQVLLAMTVTANLVMAVPKTLASAERLEEVLTTEAELLVEPESADTEMPQNFDPAALVQVEKLTYSYEEGARPALREVTFALHPGENLGIIGATGSGKSSLARLLQRFYDPQSGAVYLKGHDLKTVQAQEIRKSIATVPQRAQLFSGTVRSNLLLGLEDAHEIAAAGDEVLWQSLQIAQAADFVSAMGGLEARVERGGRNLSGGQRQRLCIARALVRRPEVLILDDAASALDYKTESGLGKALKQLPWSCSLITISQRIHSLRNSTRILLLDEGELVAAGTHDALLASSELYRAIYESQTQAAGEAEL